MYTRIPDTLVQLRRDVFSGLFNVEQLAIFRAEHGERTMPKRKSAIITGSTSGIGLGIARALASAGCNVMLNGFGEPAAS